MNRSDMLASLDSRCDWDVLIIGGGASGLGAALEATLRGYRTLLVEGSDFAKGTSSRSTKLIHGGVRYLRSGQVSMVTESLRERGRLLRNAPHIVHPIEFVLPVYRTGARWYFYAGMKLYDLLAGRQRLAPAQLLSRKRVKTLLSTLNTDRLQGGVLYWDCQFDDARLALALAQSCAENGATVLNYARVVKLEHREGHLTSVRVQDVETGWEHEVAARVVVNATGVFAEQVMNLDSADSDRQRPKIVTSQGTHIVVDADFLPGKQALLIPETDDGRVLFAIPWLGRVLIGTTDHEVRDVSLEPRPLQAEIDYLLSHAGRYLTRVPQRSDIRSAFAGLRPLVGQNQNGTSTASLSREHEIDVSPSGLITVIGGKWTTYRQMGQDVIDLAAKQAGLEQRVSETPEHALWGASQMGATELDWSDPLAGYAPFADVLSEILNERPELAESIHPDLPFLKAHVVFAARHEMARTVDDFLARRTRALLLNAAAAVESAETVSQVLGTELGFDSSRIQQECDKFRDLAEAYSLT